MPVQGLQLQPPPGHGGGGEHGVDEARDHEAAREAACEASQGNTSDRGEYFVEIGNIYVLAEIRQKKEAFV